MVSYLSSGGPHEVQDMCQGFLPSVTKHLASLADDILGCWQAGQPLQNLLIYDASAPHFLAAEIFQ